MRRLLEVIGLVLVSIVIVLFADRVLPEDLLDGLIARISPGSVATATPTPTVTPPALPPTDTPAATAAPTATPTAAPTATPTATATETPIPTDTPTPTITPGAVITGDNINVRSGPGTDFPPVGVATTGQNLDVRARNEAGDWLYVCCVGDGAAGWVFAQLAQLNTPVELLRVALPDGSFPTDTPTPTPAITDTPTATPPAAETPQAADTAAPTTTPQAADTPVTDASPTPEATGASTLTSYPCVGVAMLRNSNVACAVTNFIVVNFTQSNNVLDYDWSPDGARIALTVERDGARVILLALSDGSQVDTLGEGFNPAWSPDNQWLAFQRGDQLWSRRMADGAETQLTQDAGWRWGQAVFTPDSQAVLLAGAPADAFDANGNAAFFFYAVPAAGGERTQLAGMTEAEQGALPGRVEFSFDGARFGYETAAREDACLVRNDYITRNADGSDRQTLMPSSLTDTVTQGQRRFVSGGSFAWSPIDAQVVLTAAVLECADASQPPTVVSPRNVYVVDAASRAVVTGWASEALDFSWYRLGGRIVYTVPAAPGEATGTVQRSNLDGTDVSAFGEGTRPTYKPN